MASRRIPLVSYTTRALATVRMSAADVAATGFPTLFLLIGGERHEGQVYQIPTALVIREATGRARR